jgi:hypothetical protein
MQLVVRQLQGAFHPTFGLPTPGRFAFFEPRPLLEEESDTSFLHCSRISVTQSTSIGLAPKRFPSYDRPIDVLQIQISQRSQQWFKRKKLVIAGVRRKWSIREVYFAFSTETPIQTFAGHSKNGASISRRSARFVNT